MGKLIKITGIAIIIVAVVAGAFAAISRNKQQKIKAAGCSFSTEGLDGVTGAECLSEKVLVYTGSNGKKGLLSFDGKISDEAAQDKVYSVSENWRDIRFVAEGPVSEYMLLIDVDAAKFTRKQYHGPVQPEKTPCWDSSANRLSWTDEKGYGEAVVPGSPALEPGLYPVSDSLGSKAKYGYVNERLQLMIGLSYDSALDFSEGLAPVRKGGSWGYIDESGSAVIPFEFESIGSEGAYTFRNGLAPAKKNGMCGLIDRQGNPVVAFEFENILQGRDGKYFAEKDGRWGVLTVNEDIYSAANTTAAPEETSQTAATGSDYRVTTSGSILNLRASADPTSQIIAKIPNGTVITVTEIVSGWAHTTYNTADGWVSAEFLTPAETAAVPTEPAA